MAIPSHIFSFFGDAFKQRMADRQTAKDWRAGGEAPWGEGAPGYMEAIDWGKKAGLSPQDALLQAFFSPEAQRTMGGLPGLEEAFLGNIMDEGMVARNVQTAAEAAANEIFKTGGVFQQGAQAASGQVVRSGFGTQSGLREGKLTALGTAAGESLTNLIAQMTPQLEQFRIGALGEYTTGQQARYMDLIESMFTGQTTKRQQDISKPKRKKFLGIF